MTLEDLGRRAVACKHWRWMPGMKSCPTHARVLDLEGGVFAFNMKDEECTWLTLAAFPDLSDPATLGCLLALVEEAWRCPVDLSFEGAYWLDANTTECVYPRDSVDPFEGKTRAEALVDALEAAP